MTYRVLTALCCALFLTLPAEAKPNKARIFFTGKIEKSVSVPKIKVEKIEVSGKNALSIARKYLGTNPTKMRRLWCAAFVNHVEKKAGRKGTGSNLAKSYSSYGRGVSLASAKPGDIVVLSRKGGGHVGIFVKHNGKTVTLVSGNTGGRKGARIVSQGNYPVSRVIAVRRPA